MKTKSNYFKTERKPAEYSDLRYIIMMLFVMIVIALMSSCSNGSKQPVKVKVFNNGMCGEVDHIHIEWINRADYKMLTVGDTIAIPFSSIGPTRMEAVILAK